jgi:hypothetical protein
MVGGNYFRSNLFPMGSVPTPSCDILALKRRIHLYNYLLCKNPAYTQPNSSQVPAFCLLFNTGSQKLHRICSRESWFRIFLYFRQKSGVGLLFFFKFEKYFMKFFRSVGLFRGGHDFSGNPLQYKRVSKIFSQHKVHWYPKRQDCT